MAEFSFDRIMAKLVRMPEEVSKEIADALTKAAVQVQKTAIAKFGEYQPDYGPFNAWAVLNPATIDQKVKAGAAADDPLIGHYLGKKNSVYPSGLRQSIQIHVDRHLLHAEVGTNNPIGEWQEFGTSRGIPPRPFLRPALYQNQEWIKNTIRDSIGLGLVKWFV